MNQQSAKKAGVRSRLIFGTGISVLIYIAGVLLYALLLFEGICSGGREGVVLGGWLAVSVICGNLFARTNSPILVCLGQCVGVFLVLTATAYLFWDGPAWNKDSVTILLGSLLGMFFSVLLPNRKGKRRKSKW